MKNYGVDVAVIRADDLDRKMLAYVAEHEECTVLDLGCGGGGQSVRLACAGAQVLGVDIVNYDDEFHRLRKENNLNNNQLSFTKSDILRLSELAGGRQFDIVSIQRAIHYLSYNEALSFLKYLKTIIKDKLFISVSGLESDIGLNYNDKDKLLAERFCQLNKTDAATFSISQPVCLYTPEEFIDLLQTSGWTIEECWVSAFGNIKAVCSNN